MREFLEKHYTDEIANSDQATIKLCIKALLEVVQTGSKNVEIAVMRNGRELEVQQNLSHTRFLHSFKTFLFKFLKTLSNDEIDRVMAEIEKENEAEAEKKKQQKI